jgi:hypothetical protein
VTPPRQKQQLTKTLDGLQIKEWVDQPRFSCFGLAWDHHLIMPGQLASNHTPLLIAPAPTERRSCMGGHAEELAAAYLEQASVSSTFTACPSKQWLVKMQGGTRHSGGGCA